MIRQFLRSLTLCLAFLATPVYAVGVLALSGSQQFDNSSGAFLVGGLVYVYSPSTTTPVTVYTNIGLSTPHANPIVLPTGGRVPPVYAADGTMVRLRITNSAGVVQTDVDDVSFITAATPGSSLPQAPQLWGVGDVKTRYDNAVIEGFVRLNGRTIGSAASGATERANADAESLFKFLWPFASISVVTGKGATAAADWSANKQLTLPDMAGRLLGAMDDLGNGAQSRITAATCATPTTLGTGCGAQTQTLTIAQLPAVTPAGTISQITPAGTISQITPAGSVTKPNVTITESPHSHSYTTRGSATVFQSGASTDGWLNTTSATTGASSTGITAALDATPTFTGTPVTPTFTGTPVTPTFTGAAFGGGTAHPILPPVMLFTVYIKL